LTRGEARRRYIDIAETVLIDQVSAAAKAFDAQHPRPQSALGLFASIDANAVAARDGKTRGAITNLFGSQAEFQVESMAMSTEDRDYGGFGERAYPCPTQFENSAEWVCQVARIESSRGPQRGRPTERGYARRWLLWLSMVPYAPWSERLSEAAREEFDGWVGKLERDVIAPALEHFSEEPVDGVSTTDLAFAFNAAVEGLWLSQCVAEVHGGRAELTTQRAAEQTLTMLWRGATKPKPLS
jgi:hypothetical protein